MIVSCGEALVDMVPQPVPGGGSMNVAIAAARLGAPAAFVGRISTDDHGEAIWEHLRANGVDLRASQRGPEPIARAIVEHVPHLVFRFGDDNTADMNLTAAELWRLGDGPHILHGGTLGLFRGRTADTLANVAEAHDGLVSLDPNVRPQIIDDRDRWDHYHRRWSATAHSYKASDEDFEWIWPSRSTDSCAEELLDGATCAVLATRGADGVTVYTGSDKIDIPSQEVDAVGAGDTFVASVLAEVWQRGLAGDTGALGDVDTTDWHAVAERAVAAAAITCSRPGADPPHRAEFTA